MKKYTEQRNAKARRFCKAHRMMLVEGDIKDGMFLPIGPKGEKVETHLSALIDQHSRYVLYSRWYASEGGEIVEDTLQKAILRNGKMDKLLFDNGSQYISKHLLNACNRLGITVRHAKPYHAWTKGAIEKFNGFVDTFLEEAKADKTVTLDELNHKWDVWVEAYYHDKPHEGIREYYESLGVNVPAEGITPKQEWNRDSRPLTFLDTTVVGDAFLHHETREVDKTGCISYKGCKYEVGDALSNAKVEIGFDPNDLSSVLVRYGDAPLFRAYPLKISESCAPAVVRPEKMTPDEVERSRFLSVLEKKRNEEQEHLANAISFSGYGKGGEC